MTCFFITTGALVAQSLFARIYGGQSFDQASDVVQTQEEGYLLAGYSISFSSSYDCLIIKLDSTGSLIWAKTYGGEAEDASFGIAQENDGNYSIATRTRSYGVGNTDILTIKISSEGSLLWARTYGSDLLDEPWDICPAARGGAAIVGFTNSFGAEHPSKILVCRVGENGSLAWAKTIDYSKSTLNAAGYSISPTSDSGFAIAGIGVTTDFYEDSFDVVFIKTDTSGNVDWSRAFRGSGYDWGLSAVETYDRGFVVAGATPSSGAGGLDILVFKMDPQGSLEWGKTYGGVMADMGYEIIQTPDSGYLVSARVDNSDFGILKLSRDGSLQWAKKIYGSSWEAAKNLAPTADGCYIFVGEAGSFGASQYDAAAVKFSSDGYPGCFQDVSLVEAEALLVFDTLDITSTGVTLISTSPSLNLVSRTLTTHDICPSSAEERNSSGPSNITCFWAPGELVFSSGGDCPIRIYSPDGRLAYSGQLLKGQNRISLDQGVYLWRAGQCKGKAVVR